MAIPIRAKHAASQSLAERAQALFPRLLERVSETLNERCVPAATIADFKQAQLFRALQPARWGGLEADPRDFFDAARIVGSACPSSAWVLGVVAVHSWQLALFDDRAQDDVWGDDSDVLIASSYMPVGKVTHVDGGFRLSGKWGFSSGIDHCDWVFLGAFVPKADGTPTQDDLRTFLVPKHDFCIDDDWHVSGLQGTGSKSVVVEDKFVPAYRTHRFSDGFRQQSPGHNLNKAPLFKIPFGQMFVRTVASGGIGMLTGALREFLQVQKNRTTRGAAIKVAEFAQAQHAAAQAAATLKEVTLVFYDQLTDMLEYAKADKKIPLDKRVQWRYEASLVGPKCVKAIDDLFKASGGSAIYQSNPIQRFFNDIHAAQAHYVNNPFKPGCNFGGYLLGQENSDFFI